MAYDLFVLKDDPQLPVTLKQSQAYKNTRQGREQ